MGTRLTRLLVATAVVTGLTTGAAGASGTFDGSDIDDQMESMVGGLLQPKGASLEIWHEGEQIYRESFDSPFGSNPASDPDNAIEVFSVSKWIAATVVMTLVQDDIVGLDDRVPDILDDVFFLDPRWDDVTVRHLLSHLSGLAPALGPLGICTGYYFLSLQACVETLALEPLTFNPGSTFQYGAPGYQILGLVAERASGESWYDLVEDRLATPCELDTLEYAGTQNPWIAGGASADLNDLIVFTELQRTGYCGATEVLEQSTLAEMRSSQTSNATILPIPYSDGRNYGLGLFRTDGTANPNLDLYSHAGAAGTHPWIDTDRNYSAVLFLRGNEAIGFTSGKQIFDAILPLIEDAIDDL